MSFRFKSFTIEYGKCLLSLLTLKEKKYFGLLVGLMLLMSGVEFIGVGSLFPYIKIISDPMVIHKNIYLNEFYTYFNFKSNYKFFIVTGLIVFQLIIFKAVLMAISNYFQSKFSANLTKRLSKVLFTSYMNMSREEFIQKNTSHLMKHLLYDLSNVSSTVFSMLSLLTNLFMGIALFILMLSINPTLVIASMIIMLILLSSSIWGTRKKLQFYGSSNEINNRHAYHIADESLKAMKDIKIFLAENVFISKFMMYKNILAKNSIHINFLTTLPNVFINTMGFGLILGILLVLLSIHGNVLVFLPMLGIIALCIQRLIPIASTIVAALSVIRRFKPAVMMVQKDLVKIKDSQSSIIKYKHSSCVSYSKIQLNDIFYSYKEGKSILKNVNLTIKCGDIIGIIGKSGAGKSTLIEILIGLLKPTLGRLLIDDKDITLEGLLNYLGPNQIGYVPQNPVLIDSSFLENILFGKNENVDYKFLNSILSITQLTELVENFQHGLQQQLGENAVKISGGQKQRIGIARALYLNPKILILDEATSALDVRTRKNFYNKLSEWFDKDKIVIMITHQAEALYYCNSIYELHDSRLTLKKAHEIVG